MATFRVETVKDIHSGMFRIELYYPADATTPMTIGQPIYRTMNDAEADAIAMLKQALPDKPITAERK